MPRELAEILTSGDIDGLIVGNLNVKDALEGIIDSLADNLSHGIPVPHIPASEAADGRIFWNTDNNRLCLKLGSAVFQFRMQLV